MFLALLGLVVDLGARSDVVVLKKEMTKSQMLREAKRLAQKYDMLINRQQAWKERKKFLIKDFSKIYESEINFGEENSYGQERMQKRQRDFYSSLKAKDLELKKNLESVETALEEIKKAFHKHYGSILVTK